MPAILVTASFAVLLGLIFVAWRQYLRAARAPRGPEDTCPYGLTEFFGDRHLVNAPHQAGARWLTEIFSRSAERFPDLPALQIPHTGESLTFAELDARAEAIAGAVSPYLTGPDQVVAVAMSQDNWQIVASHLGILKAGGTVVLLDTTLPDALIRHTIDDARPVVVLTRGQAGFRGLPTLDVLRIPERPLRREPPPWLDDPAQRLATIFYTSGTTGMPKGVECPHAGYVNLALTYADYFDLLPGLDASSLTSSLGYDGSISEMYGAWVSGCAVVLLTKEQVRSGPDLIPVLRQAEVTVLFCPPVLLTTLTQAPEVDLPYPLCRYIVPAGEAFPSALVEPWTRGRRQIINTYGPTEASTDTSRQSLRPGEPVTIGSPFPNVTYVVLEVGGLRPLPHGEVGELCIGGVQVARGYRNLPETTAEKFITHPRFGRLYRTGDRCRIDIRTQRVHFLGRIDAQLKVRGHRVEAQAVEDVLQTQFGEIEAAVVDARDDALVAFVVAPSIRKGGAPGVAPAPAPWVARVTATLARQLPAPSVPAQIFLVDGFVLHPVSGKIDRRRLPGLPRPPGEAGPAAAGAGTESPAGEPDPEGGPGKLRDAEGGLAPACEEALMICRAVFPGPLGLDDGFAQAGGDSITIARLVQRLQAAGWAVQVRDLLGDCDTARKVAGRPRAPRPAPEAPPPPARSDERRAAPEGGSVLSVGAFTALQVLFALLLYAPALAAAFIGLDLVDVGAFLATATLQEYLAVGAFLYLVGLAAPFAALLWVLVLKLLLGKNFLRTREAPGVYRKWSRMHLRIWCIGRMENTVLQLLGTMYRSAPVLSYVLRRLGATVGRNVQCAYDASLSGPLGLISIGDDVSISTGAYVRATRWSGPYLHVGHVRLESRCRIGTRAGVGPGATVGAGAWVTPFTPVLGDVGPGELWEGAPARLVGRCTGLERTANACRYAHPIWLLETVNVLMQTFLSFWLTVVPTAAILWIARPLAFAGEAGLGSTYFKVTPLPEVAWRLAIYAFVATWVTAVATSLLGCLFLRLTAASPGLYPTRGLRGALLLYRMKKMNDIQALWTWTVIGQYLRALAGLRFPRVGASECDVLVNLVPELVSADSQAFWCNGAFTSMLDPGAEHITLRPLDLPRNFFCGNNCVAEHGNLPSNFLLGVSTPASDIQFRRQMRSRPGEPVIVAGNPPVRFGSAPVQAGKEARELPGFGLFALRVFLNDLFSIGLLRSAEGFVFAIAYVCLLRSVGRPLASAVAAAILAELGLVVLSVAVKAALVGRVWGADHSTPFWSWRHLAYFFAQDCFSAWCRGPLEFTAGTVLANPVLRWMGCRIGRRTIVTQPRQCSDWNAVRFGDDCIIDGFLQFHTFENMMLKVKRTRIEDRCTVDFGATVLGGAVLERDTAVRPLSLVLKEMRLTPGTYEGSPAEPASGPPPIYRP